MDSDEQRILGYYDKPGYRIIKTFNGDEAWSNILKIRYQPIFRRSVNRLFRFQDKVNSFLVIFIVTVDNLPVTIGSHFYLNKSDHTLTPTTGEGNDNMFDEMPYDSIHLPDSPKVLKSLF